MNILSLFDGISCGMVALQRAGVPVEKYYAYEIDKYPIWISYKNYPEIIQRGDVTREDFSKYEDEIDLLIGGSPCQNFSFMGRQNGLVVKNETITNLEKYLELKHNGFEFSGQSYLFWEYVRALKQCKPKYFLLENVKMAKQWRDVITRELGVEPILINSNLVSAQNRERLYWTNIPNVTVPDDKGIKLSDVIDKVNRKRIPCSHYKWPQSVWGGKKKKDMIKNISVEKAGSLTTSQGRVESFYIDREKDLLTIITADEAERLQTLPQGYTANCGASERQRYKAIGNGWTVDVIAHILKGLKKQ